MNEIVIAIGDEEYAVPEPVAEYVSALQREVQRLRADASAAAAARGDAACW